MAGFGDLREQRAAAPEPERLPHIFVLLDRWEGFTSSLGELEAGSLTEILIRLLTEGASVGMHLIMTGDRSLLLGRISSLCEEKLIFKLAEKDDYRLAGLNPRDLPDSMPPGRAFRAGTGTELQVALLAPDASGQGQTAALQAIAAHCRPGGLNRGGRPSCCPWRDRASRPEPRWCWPRRGRPRCAPSPACVAWRHCSTGRSWARRNSPPPLPHSPGLVWSWSMTRNCCATAARRAN